MASIKVPRGKGAVTITGLREGTVTVTAVTECGGLTRNLRISVIFIPIEGLEMERENQIVTVEKGKNITLKANVLPREATEKDLIWESSNPSVADVSDKGVVTGINPGRATITATAKDGRFSKRCTVEVIYVPVDGITIERE